MKYVRRTPLTFTLAAIVLLIALLTGGLLRGPAPWAMLRFGTGLVPVMDHHNFFSLVSSFFLVTGIGHLILVLAGIIFLVGAAERLMGWWRTLLAYFLTAVLGTVIGILLQAVGLLARELWSEHLRTFTTVDPFTPIAGTIMAASAFAGPLWRRRIRVLGFSVLIMFALYSGQPGDFYRLLAAVVGILLGMVLAPGTTALRWQRSSHSEMRGLLSAILVITALGPVITIFSSARFGPLHSLGLLFRDVLPHLSTVTHQCRLDLITDSACVRDTALARLDGPGPLLLTLMPLVALVVAAIGVRRGRRFAAYLAIAVNLLLAGLAAYYYGFLPVSGAPEANVSSSTPFESKVELFASAAVPLVVVVLLLVGLRHLSVRSTRRSVLRYLFLVVGSFLVLSAVYIGVGWLNRDQFSPAVSLDELTSDLPERFIPVGFLGAERITFVPTGVLPRFVYQWVGPAFWVVVIVGALIVMGTIFSREAKGDRAKARELMVRFGGGSLAFMTTWEGNRWWFTEEGDAAVAYRVINGVALTTSEPLGPATRREVAVRGFATYCDDHGWIPVFYSVHEDLRQIFTGMGWSVMTVGEETVLRPETWSTRGSKWQDVRSAINRANRLGIRAEWTSYSRLPLHLNNQIEEISEQWVAERGLPELGFTLGGLAELRDPEVAIMMAIGPDDRVEAVTSWMPSYRDGMVIGWTLDFMRRRPDSMNGVMEFLIASAVEHTPPGEVEFMSLSAAPLVRSEGEESAENAGTMRILDFIAATLEPVYGFRSLLQFKLKFQPEFHGLLMAYADPLELPAIGAALARAYLPSMSMRETVKFVRTLV